MRHVPAALVRLAAIALLGCEGSREQPAPAADTSAVTVLDSVVAPSGCRLSGLWTPCAVEDRMVHAGIVARKQDAPIASDLFSVPGTGYDVGAGDDEVQVFLYDTEVARRVDTDRMDSAAVSPKGARRSYTVVPLLVTSNNLAALVITPNPRSQERIANALSAGLPQPRP